MDELVLWESPKGIVMPDDVDTRLALQDYNVQLSGREISQTLMAYDNKAYDMSAEYVWNRAIKLLTNKVLSLGDDFVLEMLGISDSKFISAISPQDIISLAFELGFIDEEGKMKLSQSYEQIQMYTSKSENSDRIMNRNSAESIIICCVQYVLGSEQATSSFEFNNFREQLKATIHKEGSEIYNILVGSPYFYIRTTLRSLLNLLQQTEGAEFQFVSSNMIVLIPAVWDRLFSDDKYSIGFAYSNAVNQGHKAITQVLNALLKKVKGFDYVPENLRSLTFINVAQKIISTHFSANNFYNEPSVMKELTQLGNIIPKPALSRCYTATLLVKIGNFYGVSWDAQGYADQVLDSLIPENWNYYFENAFAQDEYVLSAIENSRDQFKRWCQIIIDYGIETNQKYNPLINKLITASIKKDYNTAENLAYDLRKKINR